MHVIHAVWHVPEAETDAFIEWKNVEGAMQQAAEGFLGRSLYRDLADPERYVYIAFWESVDHANSYGRTPAFREASRSAMGGMPGTTVTITRMAEVPGQQLRI